MHGAIATNLQPPPPPHRPIHLSPLKCILLPPPIFCTGDLLSWVSPSLASIWDEWGGIPFPLHCYPFLHLQASRQKGGFSPPKNIVDLSHWAVVKARREEGDLFCIGNRMRRVRSRRRMDLGQTGEETSFLLSLGKCLIMPLACWLLLAYGGQNEMSCIY